MTGNHPKCDRLVITASSTIRDMIKFADEYLRNPKYTEIMINKPGEIVTYGDQKFEYWAVDFTDNDIEKLANAVAVFNGFKLSAQLPIMTATLHDDEGGGAERIHITRSPVTKFHSVTIRKPSVSVFSMEQYRQWGLFDKPEVEQSDTTLADLYAAGRLEDFLIHAVSTGVTIVVSGATGSGKTTFLRSLMQHIPADERILTGEDVAELVCSHRNCVSMFYNSTGKSKDKDNVITPTDVLKSALRMMPSRIVFGEARGGEVLDWLNACASGHSGSLTSVHAGSVEQTIERLCMMALMSPIQMPWQAIRDLVDSVVPIVVHITKNKKTGKRSIDVMYRP